jgi:hypothetical protein
MYPCSPGACRMWWRRRRPSIAVTRVWWRRAVRVSGGSMDVAEGVPRRRPSSMTHSVTDLRPNAVAPPWRPSLRDAWARRTQIGTHHSGESVVADRCPTDVVVVSAGAVWSEIGMCKRGVFREKKPEASAVHTAIPQATHSRSQTRRKVVADGIWASRLRQAHRCHTRMRATQEGWALLSNCGDLFVFS